MAYCRQGYAQTEVVSRADLDLDPGDDDLPLICSAEQPLLYSSASVAVVTCSATKHVSDIVEPCTQESQSLTHPEIPS